MDVSTIGLDIAKSVFQVHGIDAAGEVVVRRRLKRRQLLGFLEKLGLVSSGSRLAPQPITGDVRLRRWGMRCG
jgi:transposase